MGKYMRKSKATGDVSVMEAAVAQSSLGVRTRAKTLALQQLGSDGGGGSSYLQLRSRKLEKPAALTGVEVESRKQRVRQVGGVRNPNPNFKNSGGSRTRMSRVSSKLVEGNGLERKEVEELKIGDEIVSGGGGDGDGKIEAFIGENFPDFDSRDRITRESTPGSFTRDSDNGGTPGSTTRASSSVDITKRTPDSSRRLMPTAKEMEEFFAGAEQQQHSNFIEKYNFDPVNEKPLPGRYNWVKTNP